MELIEIPSQDITKIMTQKIQKGEQVIKNGNRFVGYTTSVCTHQVIRQLYMKMKLSNPGARHIVCAYWITGQPPHYAMDYQDDQEVGAGRAILKWMKDNNMENRVFFVARYYVSKLDGERFGCLC